MNLIQKVNEAIERDGLLPEGSPFEVGVSGGADSVALLHVLQRLGLTIRVAHFNHCIRGAVADADEQFVIDLCASLKIACRTGRGDVPAQAAEQGISIEMAARDARHAFFRSGNSTICLAHHADDQLETFFLRSARGTSPAGLGGMSPVQQLGDLRLIRPLLGIRRAELIQWLKAEGLTWREDATNTDESIPRNLVRHQILPILSQINDRAAENILRAMQIVRDEQQQPELAAARRAARDRLFEFGVTPSFETVETFIAFAARSEGTTYLDLEGCRLINEYGVVRADAEAPAAATIQIHEGVGILSGPLQASISKAKLAGRKLVVRTPRPGDRMHPYGMTGSKKLKSIFADLKIPQRQRATWPLVTCGDEIVWVPGYRIARGWELSSPQDAALHLQKEIAP